MPSVFRSESPALISSHPAVEHPSPSAVTMSNAGARLFRKEPRRAYLHGRQLRLPVLPSKPPWMATVRACLIAEGWRARGTRSRVISIHSASRCSAQAPPLTGDHNICHARKLKLKGTGWFISSHVTCDQRQSQQMYAYFQTSAVRTRHRWFRVI